MTKKFKTPEQKMIYEILEKYPELKERMLYDYAGIAYATYEKIKKGKSVRPTTVRRLVDAIRHLNSMGSWQAVEDTLYGDSIARGHMPAGNKSAQNGAQNRNIKRQMELGGLCIQYGLSKRDLMKLDQIKKYEKENVLDYVIDHHMTMRSCEKIYNVSTAFDAVSAIKRMKGDQRDKSVTDAQ